MPAWANDVLNHLCAGCPGAAPRCPPVSPRTGAVSVTNDVCPLCADTAHLPVRLLDPHDGHARGYAVQIDRSCHASSASSCAWPPSASSATPTLSGRVG